MSKFNLAALGLAGFTVANLGLSTYAVTGDVNLNVSVDPAIALTIQSSSDGETIYAESDPAGQVVNNYTGQGITPFGVSSAQTKLLPNQKDESMWSKVTVYTNNAEGYKLTVSDTDDDTSLTSGSYTIPANNNISEGVSAWAFKGGKFADYTAMSPLSSALTIAESTTKSAKDGDMTEIHYGISTSVDQATGTYTDTIVYTVTGEQAPVPPSEDSVESMQTNACLNLTYDEISYLKDSRDGHIYRVVRQKVNDLNGNEYSQCWMVDNLAFDLDSSVTLTPNDTDLTENWTPIRSTLAENQMRGWEMNYNTPYSYHSGIPEYGNYYNWSAAVASNDTSSMAVNGTMAPNSICPKGWKLPIHNPEIVDARTDELFRTTAGYLVSYELSQTQLYPGGSYFQSGTVYSESQGYITTDGSTAGFASNRADGYSVRCIYDMPLF